MPIKAEIGNVEEIVDRTVAKGGKISGLSDWVGKTVKILIMSDDVPKRGGRA